MLSDPLFPIAGNTVRQRGGNSLSNNRFRFRGRCNWNTDPFRCLAMRTAPERLAICLIVMQGGLFSAETALVHHLGSAISVVHFGVIRGFAGVVTAMLFARRWDVFCTEQIRIHVLRGLAALTYGWILVYSFSRLPFADATAISYTQSMYVALFSILILGEPISRLRWLSVFFGIGGALLIAKPTFAGLGTVYIVAFLGTSLNALNFVLNRYSNLKDEPETTMVYTNLFTFMGNIPLCLFTSTPAVAALPWLPLFFFLGPLGMYAGIVALKHAEASMLGPFTLVRLVISVVAGAAIFFEFPDLPTSTGIALICLSCVLTLDGQKSSGTTVVMREHVAKPLRPKSGD
jgi:drug/metabolite transporter (DMT)-like permease